MNHKIESKDKLSSTKGLKVEAFRKHVRKTNPHKHSAYLELVFLTKGTGIHGIDFQTYEIKPPQLFIINKEQVHFWDIQSEPEGYVIILKPEYVKENLFNSFHQSIQKLTNFNRLNYTNINLVTSLIELLMDEMQTENNKKITDALLYSLVEAFLSKSNSEVNVENNKDEVKLFQSFVKLVEKQKFTYNSVQYFAEKLHTTPQNLNYICKQETQKSASEVIADLVLNEAKRKLIYTNLSSAKISEEQNFSDASHFNKYFKKRVGVTPLQFRKNVQ